MLSVRTILRSGKHDVPYEFRRNAERPCQWSAWKQGSPDPYLVNLVTRKCTCDAGRRGRKCKHLSKSLELESQLAATTKKPETQAAAAEQQPQAEPQAALAVPDRAAAIAQLIVRGNLALLNDQEKAQYLLAVCEACDLNPATRPFEFINMKGKLVLYALKSCSEQLRKRDRVSVSIVSQHEVGGVYVVTAQATTPDGRCDVDVGAVSIDGLRGDDRANAMMKAITKAKRRVTLSLCGLGMLDESEVERDRDEPPEPAKAPVGRICPPVTPAASTSSVPPPIVVTPVVTVSPPAADPAADRMTLLKEIEVLIAELKIPDAKFYEGLNRAYGKAALQALLDTELADLHKRLGEKKKQAAAKAS